MVRIALIPIDNRPVCFKLPQMILNQANEHELFLPDFNFMGNLHKNANQKELFNWIKSLKNIDVFVIALDTIAYGGLISSRRNDEKYEIIVEKINDLFKLTKQMNSKVYAFSSIMRISNNNINEEEKEYWKDWGKKIFEYSYNFHKFGKTKTDIPQEIINDYLETRKRNFLVNKYYLELKKQGLIDTLVYSKDDCAGFGINVQEANELDMLAKNTDNVFIKTGADEIPLTLISRAVNTTKKIKIFPYYTQVEYTDKISNYEDISVKKSVESQIELSGGILSNEKDCDMILFVNNFKNFQGELVMDIVTQPYENDLNIPEKPYIIADILNANGSDNNFVKKFLEKDLRNFFGYAAWNTTGNTLGSVISSALTYYKAVKPNKYAFNELQLTRFLDDWAYQANVRAKLKNNINNLNSSILKKNMTKYEKILLKKFNVNKNIKYNFPWNRFFEIDIKLVI